MTQTVKAYAIGYCSECADIQQSERLITTNETQWLLASLACKFCAHYQVEIEVKP